MKSVPERRPEWYTEEERDRWLDGIFGTRPRWYAGPEFLFSNDGTYSVCVLTHQRMRFD